MLKKLFFLALIAIALLPLGAAAQGNVMTNEKITQMLKSGLSTAVIKGAVDGADERNIQMGTTELILLKENGADDELITYLQGIVKDDHALTGIYWWNVPQGMKPSQLHRSSVGYEKKSASGGFLGAITAIGGGLIGVNSGSWGTVLGGAALGTAISSGKIKTEKMVLPGAHSKLNVTTADHQAPVFRFYFPKKRLDGEEDWYSRLFETIEGPAEFQCIKLDQKKDKRTMPKGMTWSVMGFSAKKGENKANVDFNVRDIDNHTYEVTFPQGLEPGEYCFFYKNLDNDILKEAGKMFAFDFTVQ